MSPLVLAPTPAALRAELAARGRPVGFVPTMGALHDGHMALIRRARSDNAAVVVSVFVNPKQFGPHEDFARYPRPLEADRERALEAGADVLFVPSVETMYPPGFATTVSVGPELTGTLCGAYRPGHFEGVTTVVARLLNLVRPDRAYFGQKDFQQWRVIDRMVEDLAMGVEIVRCATVREPDGLALSSRNVYLSESERNSARRLSRALGHLMNAYAAGEPGTREAIAHARERLERDGSVRVQYLEVVRTADLKPADTWQEGCVALVAAHVGATRLIDNALLDPAGPDAGLMALARAEVPA